MLAPQKGEGQRSKHKDDSHRCGQFGQKRSSPGAAEDRLTGAPERGADTRPFAVLQEHDGNQGQTNRHMNNNNYRSHNKININKGSGRRKPFSRPGIDDRLGVEKGSFWG